MKIVDKIRNKMGQNPESEEYIEEVDNTDDSDLQATTYQNPDNIVDFKNKAKNNQLKVMVIEPVSFDDAQQVADHIRNHKPVVVNFENTIIIMTSNAGSTLNTNSIGFDKKTVDNNKIEEKRV